MTPLAIYISLKGNRFTSHTFKLFLAFVLVAVCTCPASANSNPVAVDDELNAHSSSPILVSVTANDFDADGDIVSLIAQPVIVFPLNGSAVKVSGGTIQYTPDSGFAGVDRFQYEVGDGNGGRSRAWVSITIGNQAPAATDDVVVTHLNSPVFVNVTANDTDPDGDAVTLIGQPVTISPTNGVAVKISQSTIRYTPNDGFLGTDRFEYEVGDGYGGRDRAWIDVTVGNRSPIARNDTVSTTADTSVSIHVTANDTDPDGDAVQLITDPVIVAPQNGTSIKISGEALQYTPDEGFLGADTIQYEIGDGNGGRSRGWVIVNVTNQAPLAVNDSAVTGSASPIVINVTSNDSDPDGDIVNLIGAPIIHAPVHGEAIKVSASSIQYTPDSGYVGPDSFQYEIGDGNGSRSRAWVSINVLADNFSISITPSTRTVDPGQHATFTITAAGNENSGSLISLGIEGLAAGISGTLTPGSISVGQSATLRIQTSSTSHSGTQSFRVLGSYAGLVREASGQLIVRSLQATPEITSTTPHLVHNGISTITLSGHNFQGATVRIGTLDNSGGSNRAFPSVEILSISAGGDSIQVQMDATDTEIQGYFGLYVSNEFGTDGAFVRVIPNGPVVDVSSPSHISLGDTFLVTLVGANLKNASITSSHQGLRLFDIDNSDDELLSAFLQVDPGTPLGGAALIVTRDGHSIDVTMEIHADISNVAEGPLVTATDRSSQKAMFHIMPPSVNESLLTTREASKALPGEHCIVFQRSRSRGFEYTRTWFKDGITGNWGNFGNLVLSSLSPISPTLVQSRTFSVWFNLDIEASFRICRTSNGPVEFDIGFCESTRAGFHVPIVGGLEATAEFCLGTHSRAEVHLTGTGFLSSLQFHGRNEHGSIVPLRCTQFADLDPLSGSGERSFQVQLNECCTENVGVTWAGQFHNGFRQGSQQVGKAQPSETACPEDFTIKAAAFIIPDYVLTNLPCIPLIRTGAPIHGGNSRHFDPNALPENSKMTATIGTTSGTRSIIAGISSSYGQDALDDGILNESDNDEVLGDCHLRHHVARAHLDSQTNFIEDVALSDTLKRFRLHASGSNPLFPDAPPINFDLTVSIHTDTAPPRFTIVGTHDCFPAYEVSINGITGYGYMPFSYDITNIISCLMGVSSVPVNCQGFVGGPCISSAQNGKGKE